MYAGENDNITTVVLTNPFEKDDMRKINILKQKFLPYIEMSQQSFDKNMSDYDVLS